MSVRSHTSETACPNFTKFSVLVTTWPWLGPSLTTVQCVTVRIRTSGFVVDVMFSHNGPNTDTCWKSAGVANDSP